MADTAKLAAEANLAAEPKPSKFALPRNIQQHLMQGLTVLLRLKDLYTLWGYRSSLRDGLCLSELIKRVRV
ncbi:hypothetical protein O9929_02220 [Vibrio lentus]|nr:hypothetical protein [Vibrio lentus]